MPKYCPYESGLECSNIDQVQEFHRQMNAALLDSKPTYFLTGRGCPCYSSDCAKLLAYREKTQNCK